MVVCLTLLREKKKKSRKYYAAVIFEIKKNPETNKQTKTP